MDHLVKTERIVRHSPPGEFDQLPKGTLAEVISKEGKVSLFEQQSENTDHPFWKDITDY